MKFKVQRQVLEKGVKVLFVVIENVDNKTISEEYIMYRNHKVKELYEKYKDFNVKEDKILEGYHLLHDYIHVKRRKNVPASENLIRMLIKRKNIGSINKIIDLYNLISIDSALGAHDMDQTEGNVTLRFTDGSENYQPLQSDQNVKIALNEYAYIDDSNTVLCRLEIRQVKKTLVNEDTRNVWYIVQGNEFTDDSQLMEVASQIIEITTAYCSGTGKIIIPDIIDL